MNSPLIIQVVGYSKTGKTTLITELIKLLNENDLKIFAIKSARSHEFEFSNKDSDKFLESGAQSAAVVFKNFTQISLIGVTEVETLIKIVSELNQYKIVILEGFKELPYPKIQVYSNEIPSFNELDFSTIRYLYSSNEQNIIRQKSLSAMMKSNEIALVKSIQELASRIILDLEKRG